VNTVEDVFSPLDAFKEDIRMDGKKISFISTIVAK